MTYQVGIDLGTTSTVAAVCRPDGTAQVVPLEGPTGAVVSAVHLGVDGTLRVGEAAARRALSEPGRVVRDLMRRVGDDTPLLVGHEPVPAAERAAVPGRDGLVAVYDLGGGRFEASVVRAGEAPALAGPPEELERFGGADLDELVFDHVRTALGAAWDGLDPTAPDVLAAVADL